jgi:hypothetical protein
LVQAVDLTLVGDLHATDTLLLVAVVQAVLEVNCLVVLVKVETVVEQDKQEQLIIGVYQQVQRERKELLVE